MNKDLPEEHPDTTLARMRTPWLCMDRDRVVPETLLEFLQETDKIAREWFERWNGLWKKVNPNFFKNKEDKDRWVREQELKQLAAWHLWRAQRMYWHDAGFWLGNPMDPDDKGEWVVEAFDKPAKKKKRAK